MIVLENCPTTFPLRYILACSDYSVYNSHRILSYICDSMTGARDKPASGTVVGIYIGFLFHWVVVQFDLIAVPLSLLLHFIPLCGALVVLVLALSSYLGCLALFIYVYGRLSCPTRIICGCPGLFRFCSLVFPLLNPFLVMTSSAGHFHARFLLSAFFPVCLSYFYLFIYFIFILFSGRDRPRFVLV